MEGFNGLVQLDTTFFFQIFNTVVLYFILKKLLFKPVTSFLKTRQEEVAKTIEEANKSKFEAEEYKKEHLKKIEEAKEEGRAIVNKAVKRSEEKAQEIIEEAKIESKKLIETANSQIELEKQKAVHELKREVSDMAILVASKLIQKDMNKQDHENTIEDFIKEVGEVKWQS